MQVESICVVSDGCAPFPRGGVVLAAAAWILRAMLDVVFIVLVCLTVILALLQIILWARPSVFRVTRAVYIAAPPAAVFAEVEDLRRWQAWSPWAPLDPDAKRTYAGPESGPGAQFAWDGNQRIGAGKMTITGSRPGAHLEIRLQFTRPFAAENRAEFHFAADGPGTQVTWALSGRVNSVMKVMGLFMDFPAAIGGEFARGLANLKRVVEAGPRS
jgi:hypothetical protein